MNDCYQPIQLLLNNVDDTVRPGVVVAGIPLPSGYLIDGKDVRVVGGSDRKELPFTLETNSRWPDGSARWCLLRILVSVNIDSVWLERGNACADNAGTLQVVTAETIEIVDKELRYRFAPDALFPGVVQGSSTVHDGMARLVLADADGAELPILFERPALVSSDHLSARVCVNGRAGTVGARHLKISILYDIFSGGDMVVTCEIHNPHRAMHPDGIWDLGDAGSVLIKSLSLVFPSLNNALIHLRTENDEDWLPVPSDASFELYQASSGGEHWDSPTHLNASSVCSNEFKGYRLTLPAGEVISGARATPAVILEADDQATMSMTPLEFWQNFPKKISAAGGALSVDLFPDVSGDYHEIQGGERKRHRIHFAFGEGVDAIKRPSHFRPGSVPLTVDRRIYQLHNLLDNPVGEGPGSYDQLLEPSLDLSRGFVAKRESQDEFGWRHFGDVVADHETLYHTDGSYFVSHYNNQYDCVYGFARQYLLSGDSRWFRLMGEHARHVLDIDIYRTDEDRAEYNNGLFWHTDHYRKALTATHRTYSREHYPEDWSGPKGGGPGAEHCYTTGLKLYYYISGDSDAKDGVIRLTEWVENYYEGSGTFIEFAKSIITHDLKMLLSTLKGNRLLRYRYPLDRGIGNYIRALIDSYELTKDVDYLERAARVIGETFGASDDIEMRNLDDIEGTWFYTVFLQDVVRFLDVKRELEQYDSHFYKARDGLLHYARWMARNEKPYLLQPEKLEYPNDTWAAQDIRKANVLYGAYLYASDDRDLLLDRARYFKDYVIETLGKSDTLHFARIQALLLQNHGPADAMGRESEPYNIPEPANGSATDVSLYRVIDFVHSIRRGLFRVIKTTNPKREYAWVRIRLGK